MFKNWLENLDRTNAIVAFGVWLTAFIVYLLTKAPTMTFWDCGEFIACSYVLGIPHPPGTPLYILIGRLFSIVPIFSDIAARLNFFSVLGSSLAAMFGYLVGVRIVRSWFKSDTGRLGKVLLYAGPAAGALFFAFSKTQWGNSIEAEVYALAMLLFMVIFWLTLIYHDMPQSRAADLMMLLITYLSFLGIAAHPTTFLIFPIAAVFLVLKKDTPGFVWFVGAAYIFVELYLIFALSSRAHEVPYYVPVVIVFILYLFYIFSLEFIPRVLMYLTAGFVLAIAPLYQILWVAIKRVASGSTASTIVDTGLLSLLGGIVFGGVVIAALIFLFRELSAKSSKRPYDRSVLTGSIILVAAGVMTAILLAGIRGYTMFGVLSVLLLLVVGGLIFKYIRWPILIAVTGIGLAAIGVKPFFFGSIIAAVALLILGALFRVQGWKTAISIIAVAWIGYSVHAFLPIRSADQPAINENNVSSGLTTLVNYLDRKQYITESMTERMFVRRGSWENQFGNYRRMGFWRFFDDQYGLSGPKFFIVFVLGMLGLWEAIRFKSQFGLFLFLIILVSSVGLVLYMNFADGTRQNPVTGEDYIEVRDRDYFWTQAFLFFGLAIGMGASALLIYLRQAIQKFSAPVYSVVMTASLVIFLLPIYALAGNYHEIDRSNNYIPYDYGRNILETADPNAVLITYGDNDTFPLWCLQSVFGIRPDVRVVNLSLANVKWYIKQIQSMMGIDLGWSDAQIDALRGYRTQDGLTFGLQDQVVDAIIDHNRGERPLNFSVTVASDGRKYHGRSADAYLELSGLKWRFRGQPTGMSVDVDGSLRYFLDPDKFRLRGLGDPNIYKDDNMLRLTSNYTNSLVMVVDSLRVVKRFREAEQLMQLAVENLPYTPESFDYLASLYAEQGKIPELKALIERGGGDTKRQQTMLARALRKSGGDVEAETILRRLLSANPTYRPAFEELARLYYERKDMGSLRIVMQQWMQSNPGDRETEKMLREFDKQMTTQTAPAAKP